MTFLYENVLVHVVFADSAQPRKASNVTRPFPILWVGSGDETKFLAEFAHTQLHSACGRAKNGLTA